jgi:hypothetical protein
MSRNAFPGSTLAAEPGRWPRHGSQVSFPRRGRSSCKKENSTMTVREAAVELQCSNFSQPARQPGEQGQPRHDEHADGRFITFGDWSGKTADGPTWTVAIPSSVPGKCCLFVAYPGGISVKTGISKKVPGDAKPLWYKGLSAGVRKDYRSPLGGNPSELRDFPKLFFFHALLPDAFLASNLSPQKPLATNVGSPSIVLLGTGLPETALRGVERIASAPLHPTADKG